MIWNNPYDPSRRHILQGNFGTSRLRLSNLGMAVLVGASFIDFLPDERPNTALTAAFETGSGAMLVRFVSKFTATPSLRFGYAIGTPVESRASRGCGFGRASAIWCNKRPHQYPKVGLRGAAAHGSRPSGQSVSMPPDVGQLFDALGP